MLTKIKSVDDVRAFARQILLEDVSLHPDDDFRDYISLKTQLPTYTTEEAEFRNRLMDQCFRVCERSGESVYNIMLAEYLRETGLSKFATTPA